MKDWQPDMRYTDTYWSKADSEEEYVKLIKSLYDKRNITETYLGSEWTEEKRLVDDLCMWHEYFDTDCMYDDKYEYEDMPDPSEYNGNYKYKPEKQEYPVVMQFELLNGKHMMSWYSIN